jgi:DNA primase
MEENPKTRSKEEIINDLDLLRKVVKSHLNLNSSDYGLCPFHEEKTPSFHIYKARSGKARYHCFGCEANGDAINFVSIIEGLSFKSALEKLGGVFLLSSTPEHPSGVSSSCEQGCQKYINLREDYDFVSQENKLFRLYLNLGEKDPGSVGWTVARASLEKWFTTEAEALAYSLGLRDAQGESIVLGDITIWSGKTR